MISSFLYHRGNYLEYSTDVIDLDVPILFGLEMMKKVGWYVNEVTNEFCSHANPELKAPLVFKRGHLYLEWAQSVVLYTRVELGKLHRRFAHPTHSKEWHPSRSSSKFRCPIT